MAVIAVTTKMVAGVKYTHTTADSADWSSISNDTYFYDLTDELVYYKNNDGLVEDVYKDKSNRTLSINAQNGASYTLVLSDAGKLVTMNNGSGNTLTIPTNIGVAFPIGTQILVKQIGNGATTFASDPGVTIQSYLSRVVSLGQYSLFTLIKTGTNTWSLGGNLT